MASNDSDDPSFADEMARMGVTPLGRARTGKHKPSAGSRGAAGRQPGPGIDPKPKAKSKPAPDGQESGAARELAALRTELARAQAGRAALEQERAQEQAAWQVERAGMEARLQEERASVAACLKEQRAQLEQSWNQERKKRDAKERELRLGLSQAEATLARHISLIDALRARGCANESEAITVLQQLLDVRPRDLLESVDMIAGEPFTRLLDQRVAFVAEGVDMDTGPDCVIVRVPPERCEVTGGSDIQAAFRKLVAACKRVEFGYLTIVGGSPAYRRQLRNLTQRYGEGVVLNLVSGTQRRTRKRAEADLRASDRVIIWGATELDHSVSAVYTGVPEKIVRVIHRGISRMLLQVAESLDAR
jgi:hypothetical protein